MNGKRSLHNRGAITKQKPKARPARKPPAAPRQEEYSIKRWPRESSLFFKNCVVWDEKKFVDNIKSITFGPDFAIKEYVSSSPVAHKTATYWVSAGAAGISVP
jgi:hypothetical protein